MSGAPAVCLLILCHQNKKIAALCSLAGISAVEGFVPSSSTIQNKISTTRNKELYFFGGGSASKEDLDEQVCMFVFVIVSIIREGTMFCSLPALNSHTLIFDKSIYLTLFCFIYYFYIHISGKDNKRY